MSLYSFHFSANKNNQRKVESLPRSIFQMAFSKLHILISCKETLRYIRLSAVFTVEAAVIVPLLTCFFISILFFFRVMQVELEVQKALDDTGRQLAVYLSGEESGNAAGSVAAKALFLKEMSGREAAERYISGGSMGVSLAGSKFKGDEIRLKASYRIRLPVRIFWAWNFDMIQKADCKKWNGWNGAGEDGAADSWVYITETGTVYHMTKTCSHLALSIRAVDYEQLSVLRNENGGKYHKCTLCAGKDIGGRIYITNQGDSYHRDLNCSGIKRTIFMVRLSEVGTRRRCSRCGIQRG